MCLKKEGKGLSAIVLVTSPLISLIKDQVKSLQKKEIKASLIGSGQEEANFKQILTGEMNIVYSSPEAILSNDQWREMVLFSNLSTKCCCGSCWWSALNHPLVRENIFLTCSESERHCCGRKQQHRKFLLERLEIFFRVCNFYLPKYFCYLKRISHLSYFSSV